MRWMRCAQLDESLHEICLVMFLGTDGRISSDPVFGRCGWWGGVGLGRLPGLKQTVLRSEIFAGIQRHSGALRKRPPCCSF